MAEDVNNDATHSKTEERKIVVEFCQLQEKSRQLFNSLRDLPQFGNKHWQTHFGKTFDVYTRLWKFQQKHRSILDAKYNLKRWQIGEIASKIGQLYYHYYLRTSEANYLHESFGFYSAIRSRAYYSQASKEEKPDLMVKKLRYYARFIVVSLLLNKVDLVKELIQELHHYVEEYVSVYEAQDDEEWRLVISEVTAFMEADSLVTVMTPDVVPVTLSHRMAENEIPAQRPVSGTALSLQEIIIVGNCEKQVKFSELTLDMFRMLQALEREPEEVPPRTLVTTNEVSESPSDKETSEIARSFSKRPNPHKYLLYKPTLTQLYVFLACGLKELPSNGVMLVYVSGDGCLGNAKAGEEGPYEMGGVAMCHKKAGNEEGTRRARANLKDVHCLYPEDLVPFSRKPLMVIVDSSNSYAFRASPAVFRLKELICINGKHESGTIFTIPEFCFPFAQTVNRLVCLCKCHTYVVALRHVKRKKDSLLVDVRRSKKTSERVLWPKRRTPTAKSAHISRRIHLLPQGNQHSNESVTGGFIVQTNKSALYRIASLAFSFKEPVGFIYALSRRLSLAKLVSSSRQLYLSPAKNSLTVLCFHLQYFPSLFGQPLISLMSPITVPTTMQEQTRKGSLFSLFLFSPLVAFCYVCSIADLRSDLWDSCHRQVRRIMNDCLRVFYDWSRCVDLAFLQLLDDEFLRLMIIRFVFCFYTMHLHRAFKGSDYYPKSFPKLPAEILLNGGIEKQVLELASMLDVRSLFYEIGEGPPTD
ncbi:unnamed protein product [Porites evermanni]|uniref:Protein SCAI n=1 Tax=Porites evermanni TaxID=104178 RepID=A0ABN8MEH8_9CNID|nr:unnamed protein product [Porites evermanni]